MGQHFNPRTYSHGWADYELIDAGGGKKLERFGKIITIRPEVQAYFQSELSFSEWRKKAHVEFITSKGQKGNWKALRGELPTSWPIKFDEIELMLKPTGFKHLGVFPEQSNNWKFIKEQLNPEKSFLNLFAYTGAASLIARSTGAEVTHVDAVRQLVTWSKNNMEQSQLQDIRWIVEDALKFAQRAVKRGNKYDGIIMDPPAFGHGAKGQKWILDQQLSALFEAAAQLLSPTGFLIVNTYSPKVDIETLTTLAKKHFGKRQVEVSELWMQSATEKELYYGNLLRVF